MKACFFSSPIGLGHVTRDIAIADRLEFEPEFVTGSGAAGLLRMLGRDVRDAYSPPSFSVRGGALRDRAGWLWRYYAYYRDCKGTARRIIARSRPDIVISDEDFASLAVAHEMEIPTVLVTDILETRFTGGLASLIERGMNRSMRSMMERCDAVILPERGADRGNVRRVGPIVRGISHTRGELRKKFSFDAKTVVITAGGTDAGTFLIRRALGAAAEAGADAVVVPGPAITGSFPGARNMGFVPDMHEVIFAADALVSLAGRSTIDEARAYGTPAVFIPIRGHFEQEDNAAREGFAHGDIGRLGGLLAEKLQEPRRPEHAGGAEAAAGIIGRAGSNA